MNPNFYAVIPATVRYDENIIPNAKLLYGEISAMCNIEGFCWAENAYFAKLYNVSVSTISRWISQLELRGHISTILNKKEGNSRKIFIKNSAEKVLTKSARPIDEKRKTLMTKSARPIDEKRKSIYENITINNTMNREKETLSLSESKIDSNIEIKKGNSALEFFEKNYPSRYEALMMQFKKQITDFVKFEQLFEATVLQEKLEYDGDVLEGRFRKFAINWVANQNKYESPVIELNANKVEPTRKFFRG